MKTVAFYAYAPKIHSLYKEIINHPPKGYKYSIDKSKIDSRFKNVYNNPTYLNLVVKSVNKVVDMVWLKDHLYKYKRFPEHDLLYSAGHLCARKEPWIVDMEMPAGLTGYSIEKFERRKKAIARLLSAKHCKRIIPWSDDASEMMRKAFPSKTIREKILTVPLVVSPKKHKKKKIKKNGDKIRILYVGSCNVLNDFYLKGGLDALEAYKRIANKYDVEMIFRGYIPKKHFVEYSKVKGLKIINELLPFSELEKLYYSSDIFVGPAHYTPGLAHLEAMSYGLPVIATDTAENAKIVNRKVGLLIPEHSTTQYRTKYGFPLEGHSQKFFYSVQSIDEKRIHGLVRQLKRLIEDSRLRVAMGRNALRQVETGAYSITKRNKLLKEVYDAATRH